MTSSCIGVSTAPHYRYARSWCSPQLVCTKVRPDLIHIIETRLDRRSAVRLPSISTAGDATTVSNTHHDVACSDQRSPHMSR